MPVPESVRAKLDQAKLHLNSLNAEAARYLASYPGEVVPNPDGDPNISTFVYRQRYAVPSRINLLAGDCIQNLRSAFDYLIWELVLIAGNIPTRKNMFPVCHTLADFKEAKRRDQLTGIVAGSEALIESLQPYTHTQPAEHWLAILNELANINKHRRLLLATLSGFSVSGLMEDLNKLADSTAVSGVIHETANRGILTAEQVQMQDDFLAFVAFNEGAVKNMEVGLAVETHIGIVTSAIQPFEHFFI